MVYFYFIEGELVGVQYLYNQAYFSHDEIKNHVDDGVVLEDNTDSVDMEDVPATDLCPQYLLSEKVILSVC